MSWISWEQASESNFSCIYGNVGTPRRTLSAGRFALIFMWVVFSHSLYCSFFCLSRKAFTACRLRLPPRKVSSIMMATKQMMNNANMIPRIFPSTGVTSRILRPEPSQTHTPEREKPSCDGFSIGLRKAPIICGQQFDAACAPPWTPSGVSGWQQRFPGEIETTCRHNYAFSFFCLGRGFPGSPLSDHRQAAS